MSSHLVLLNTIVDSEVSNRRISRRHITDVESLVEEILANIERLNNVDVGQFVLVAKSFENQTNHSVGQISSILDDDM